MNDTDSLETIYLKATLHSVSPFSAAGMEIARANKMDPTIPHYLVYFSTPGMLLKQYINVVQLISACQWLVEGDKKERRRLNRS